jgi:transposase-like protein
MPESYSWEIREAAEELYIIDGRTYEQVAEAVGVSISQLKRWGTESVPTWSERRKEYRQAQTSVRHGVMLAKAKLIESVIQNEDAQKAYAFSALVSSGKALDEEARARMQAAPAEPPIAANGQPVDMVEALGQAIQTKVGAMLTQPGAINLTAIKELQQAIELLEKIKKKDGAAVPGDGRQMTVEELQAEIKKVYGI